MSAKIYIEAVHIKIKKFYGLTYHDGFVKPLIYNKDKKIYYYKIKKYSNNIKEINIKGKKKKITNLRIL